MKTTTKTKLKTAIERRKVDKKAREAEPNRIKLYRKVLKTKLA